MTVFQGAPAPHDLTPRGPSLGYATLGFAASTFLTTAVMVLLGAL
jgi:hypothetical protein